MAGVFALLLGILMPFGGAVEGFAAGVFGSYFLVSLALAYRAIRAHEVPVHRRWMIRAFAVGLGVGMIRVWIILFQAFGFTLAESFGLSFRIAFSLHALAAEIWLRLRPAPYVAPPWGTPAGR